MGKFFITFLGGLLLALQVQAAANKMDSLSYAMGYQLGVNFKLAKVPLQQDSFLQGLQTGLTGGKSLLSTSEIKAATHR